MLWWYVVRALMVIIGIPAVWLLTLAVRFDMHIVYIISNLMLVVACVLTYMYAQERIRRR